MSSPTVVSNAMIGSGSTLSYSTDDSSYTALVEVVSVDLDGPDTDVVKVTALDTPSFQVAKIPGLQDPGKITLSIHYAETQMNVVYPIFSGRTIYFWKLSLPDGSYFKMQGFPNKFKLTGQVDKEISADVDIEMTVKPSFTVA